MANAKINPDLEPLARPLGDLHCDPKNARKHGKRDLETIAASLDLHGQQKPIVAMRDGKVIAGNGTLEAARALGWDRIACVTYDDEDAAKAAAFAIVDNRSAELSEWDFETLAANLHTLHEDLLATVGFVDYELEPLLRAQWAPSEIEPLPTRGESKHVLALSDEEWTVFQEAAAFVAKGAEMTHQAALVAVCRAALVRPAS